MPLPTQSLANIRAYARAFFRTQFPGFAMGAKQFLGQSAAAVGMNAWHSQKVAEDVDIDIVPTAQSSATALSGWAFLLGLPNGASGYGPFVPSLASGGVATLTGVKGTIYPLNAVATAPDGQTQVQLSASVTISGSAPGLGSVSGSFAALTAGSIGNIASSTVMTWLSPPAGADPTFTLTTGLTGGLDTETNGAIFARILSRLQNPPRGGTSQDYKTWAQLLAVITGVYVYPRRNGTGTVDVVIVLAGSGTGRVPTAAQQTSAQAFIDANRPVAADAVNILLPFTAVAGHVLRTRVVPQGTLNAFDWGSDATWTGIPFTLDTGGYSAGPPATIRLNTLAPQSLKSAIDAYIAGTGPQPRLQVVSTNYVPATGAATNPPVGTSKTTTWSDSGGKTTITLDTLPTGWVAPSNGDAIFPYGPIVATIANAQLAYINGLGPSRVSGYADAFSLWSDTISVQQLARIAEDAVDSGGNPLVAEVLASSPTIDASYADLQAADSTPSVAPELLFAKSVAITP